MSIVSRRSFVGIAVVAVAAGAGVTAEFIRHPRRAGHETGSRSSSTPTSAPPSPVPPVLALALEREKALLARLDAAARATPTLRARLSVLRADHRAHVNALAALITAAGATASTSAGSTSAGSTPAPSTLSPSSSVPSRASAVGSTMTATEVVGMEKQNAAAAARDCPVATGAAAAVLASIYACEQTHVAWLG